MKSSILMDIRELQGQIIDMSDRVDALRRSLYGRAIRYDSMRRAAPAAGDILSGRLSVICDKDRMIRRRQRRLDARKERARGYLRQLDNPDYALALDLFYLSVNDKGRLYTWADVAEIMGKSRDYVQKVIHYRALDKLNNIL